MKIKVSLRIKKWKEKDYQVVTRRNKSHIKKRKYIIARGRKTIGWEDPRQKARQW